MYLKPKGVTELTEEGIKQLNRAFLALEESECCERQMFKPNHAFHIDVFDNNKQVSVVREEARGVERSREESRRSRLLNNYRRKQPLHSDI